MDSDNLISQTDEHNQTDCPPGVIQMFKMMNKLQYYSVIMAVLYHKITLFQDYLYFPCHHNSLLNNTFTLVSLY